MQHERRCATRAHLVGGLVAPHGHVRAQDARRPRDQQWSRSSRSMAGPACDQDPTRQPLPQSRTRTAALLVSQSKSTYLAVRYRRSAITTSPVKTIVAIEQHADHDLADCHDRRPRQRPGRDFYTRRHPEKAKKSRHRTTTRDGVPVTLELLQEPAMRESSGQSSGSLPGGRADSALFWHRYFRRTIAAWHRSWCVRAQNGRYLVR